MSPRTIYFSGLNELRAIAALAVLVHHIELYKYRDGLPSLCNVPILSNFIFTVGHNGVLLFFTLSGFLVTYLLLNEKGGPTGIQILPFYMRRILRIWPLYFITLIIGFGLIPFLLRAFPEFFLSQRYYNGLIENIQFGVNFLLYFFFLSNLALKTFPHVPGATQNWSVSMEEQFYLVWPWVIKYSGQFLIWILIAIILIANICHSASSYIWYFTDNQFLINFLIHFDFDFMAFGAISAIAYYRYPDQISRLFQNKIFVALLGVLIVIQMQALGIRVLKTASFCGIILTAIVLKFSFKPLDWLGKISYGLYMYHPLVIYVVFASFSYFGLPRFWLNPFIYVFIPGITVAISLLSYKYIELPFLRKKDRFSTVKSGNIDLVN